jgi:transcriptional regulator with XRE-family HTH domain
MRGSAEPRRRKSSRPAVDKDQVEAEFARLTVQVTDEISWHMRSLGISRADLAARMGVSLARVSRILSGGEIFSLHTLARVATAVGARFDVQMHNDDGIGRVTGRLLHGQSPAGAALPNAASVWPTRSGYWPSA